MTLPRAATLVAVMLTACGGGSTDGGSSADGGGTPGADAGFDRAMCTSQCQGNPRVTALQYCGTDHRTYAACDWLCNNTPAGVGVFPSACQSDGTPQPGSPQNPADGVTVCDWTDLGNGDWQAVACATDLEQSVQEYTGGDAGRAGGFAAPRTALPMEVDHRGRFVPPKDQRPSDMCTAFSTLGAMEGAVGMHRQAAQSLSEMHLWARYHRTNPNDAITAARSAGVATTAVAEANGLPFDADQATAWLRGTSMPDPAVLQRLDAMAQTEIAVIDLLAHPAGANPTPDTLAQVLADGYDIAASFFVGGSPWGRSRVGADGVIPDYDQDSHAGHAVLLVGYRQINGGRYFIVRNSWGTHWGDHGYGYLSDRALAANLIRAPQYVVTVQAPTAASAACADGQALAADGTCRMTCDNGGLADETGACPAAGACAGGAVDAHGACVRGCITGTGTVAGVGDYTCSPGGCRWTVAAGALDCTGTQPCLHVCQAPACEGFATDRMRFACRGEPN